MINLVLEDINYSQDNGTEAIKKLDRNQKYIGNEIKNCVKNEDIGNHFYNKINTFPYGALDKIKSSLSSNSTINIGIIGDSISVGVSQLGISYSTYPKSGESSVGLTQGDSYYNRLVDMFTEAFPNKTFNFHNYAVGGTIIQQWGDNQTFESVTGKWIDFLKDKNLDMLIIGFGMNNSAFSSAVSVRYYLQELLSYISANFTTNPSVCCITTPRPYCSTEDIWGSIQSQTSREIAAFSVRKYATSQRNYVIDVNKISNIYRLGKNYEAPIMRNIANSSVEAIKYLSNTNYLYDENEEFVISSLYNLIFNIDAKDFTIIFDCRFTGFSVNSSDNLQVDFNVVSDGNTSLRNPMQIFPRQADVGVISLYPTYVDASHGNTASKTTLTYSLDDNTTRKIRIEKRCDLVDVYLDDIRVNRARYAINNANGLLILKKVGTATSGVVYIKNLKLYIGDYEKYTKVISEQEMFGIHILDDYINIRPPYGGNGANHPSTLGIEKCYVPCLQELIEDLI